MAFRPQAAHVPLGLEPYERAPLIVTTKKAFSARGEVIGDDAVATAMIDRLVHHAEIRSSNGDNHRLCGKDLSADGAQRRATRPEKG